MPSVDLRWRKSHSVNEVHFFYGGHKCRTLQKFSPCRCSIALTMIRRLSAYQTSEGVRQARALSEMAASNQKHPLLPVLEKWMPVSSNSRILPLVEARMAMSLSAERSQHSFARCRSKQPVPCAPVDHSAAWGSIQMLRT